MRFAPSLPKHRGHGPDHVRVHPVSVAGRVALEVVRSRQVHLDGHGLALNLGAQPADLIEHLLELRDQVFVE